MPRNEEHTTSDADEKNASAGEAVPAPNPDGPRLGDRVRSPLAPGRETVESIVVAFTLALLFRAFEAEAFVIPTGSMAPTLMGRHKDLVCGSCGLPYRVGCSAEEDDQSQGLRMELARLEQELTRQRSVVESSLSTPREREEARARVAELEHEDGPIAQRRGRLDNKLVAGGRCPNCGLTVGFLEARNGVREYDPRYPSFSGDRILVNKFAYDFAEPERWDVVVFRYPEDAKINYIKRLVGLPGETVSIAAGDIWTSRDGGPPRIARKPDRKRLAMLQCVHDAAHVSRELVAAGWPEAWADWSAEGAGDAWRSDDGGRSFTADPGAGTTAMLRYRHMLPTAKQWAEARDGRSLAGAARPEVITDFQPYNALAAKPHWVGDIAVEVVLESRSDAGGLEFDLVEAGRRHRCRFDLATGGATLSIAGQDADAPSRGTTPVRGAGSWKILFANVDDELSLFVDGRQVKLDRPARWESLLEAAVREEPRLEAVEPGSVEASDLAPVGIAVHGAGATVRDMRVLRDTFYLSTALGARVGEFLERQRLDFPLESGQYFVLGDNSAASKDSRLWSDGHHVDRHLLIGEAMLVFWPHAVPAAWGIPLKFGRTELRLPSWPNFARMRFVR
jgi:signal peptidase I